MDTALVILLFVCTNCLVGLFISLRRFRSGGHGWTLKYLTILLLGFWGWAWSHDALIYLAAGLWMSLVLLPGLLARWYNRLFLQQRYATAHRVVRLVGRLHPADGWQKQSEIVRAVMLAQRGELPAATEILQRYQHAPSSFGFVALATLCRLADRWEAFLDWQREHPGWEYYPEFIPVLLRARGETGDVAGLIYLYDRHKARIARINLASHRDQCRLMLFAFCGKREMVEQLFGGSLSQMPKSTQQFWLATADLTAGKGESAREQFQALLPVVDASLQLAIRRRLRQANVPPPPPLNAQAEAVINFAELEHGQEARFGAARHIFSKQARMTQLLIVLNVMMFSAEILSGGSTDVDVLFRMGALFPPSVVMGEWWRIGAALFLHFGPLHLLMNMLALAFLGPFLEFAFGRRRFLLLYLGAGISSMLFVCGFASGPTGEQLTVGASGCVMGLVGATGALMLRGWRREKARIARRRLIVVLTIIASQAVFDAIIPQVSMAGHLSGTVLGFVLALGLSDRLKSPLPQSRPVS